MATYLDAILRAHVARAAADRRDVASLVDEAGKCPPTRGFCSALRRGPIGPGTAGPGTEGPGAGIAAIAEVKRRSPSKGPLALDLVPAVLAKSYAAGGAACLSVLTDGEFFGGSRSDLTEAREAVGLPVLRKDFTVAAADVCDARLMGADAVLLIVSALAPPLLAELVELCKKLAIDALVEVHDEAESEVALASGAALIGVNQRDLMTFEVDPERAVRVGRSLPSHIVKVAESGIRVCDDVARLADAGYDAVLVGEALVTSPDPGEKIAELLGRAGC